MPQEKTRPGQPNRAASAGAEIQISICGGGQGVGNGTFSLKQRRCRYCGCAESLNRHSKLYGNDPAQAAAQAERGQRVFCSNRGQRGGCGRTFSIFLAEVLPRHTLRAPPLWKLLKQLLSGSSVKAAVEKLRLPLMLQSCYHLLARWTQRLDALRARLCQRLKPPSSSQKDPLLQTAEHLQRLFAGAACPLSQFQLSFQHPLLG